MRDGFALIVVAIVAYNAWTEWLEVAYPECVCVEEVDAG